MLERSWVGRRVSVRRAVRHPSGEGVAFSDVVGDLIALDADHAVVETRTDLVEIPVTHVAMAKLVPASTRDELDLQAVIARGWVAAESEQLGGWTLRANGGFTGRANSVLALAPVGLPMDDALDAVTHWYEERGLPPQFMLAVEGRRLLDADLAERGWQPSDDVHVMTRRLTSEPWRASDDVAITAEPSEEWLSLYRDGAAVTPEARGLLMRHGNVGFAELRVAGELVAIARATVDDDWLGVNAVEVAPDARRRGYATVVMNAVHQWGTERGTVRAHLEVSATNTAAVAFYDRLGFHVHHDYRYRTAPST